MTAASSPNEAGDQTGGLNKVFGYVYQVRIKAKAFEETQPSTVLLLKVVPNARNFLPDLCSTLCVLKYIKRPEWRFLFGQKRGSLSALLIFLFISKAYSGFEPRMALCFIQLKLKTT